MPTATLKRPRSAAQLASDERLRKRHLEKVMAAEGTTSHTSDVFAAQPSADGQEEVVERPAGVQGATVTGRETKKLVMYDSEGRASLVSNNDLLGVRTPDSAHRLYFECPLCQGEHANLDDPNGCPSREPLKFTECPLCRVRQPDGSHRPKRIFDVRAVAMAETAESSDPNKIPMPFTSTPESRIRAKYEHHIVTYHPRTAREQGIVINPALIGA
jgi:hypothetical protein